MGLVAKGLSDLSSGDRAGIHSWRIARNYDVVMDMSGFWIHWDQRVSELRIF